MNTYTVPRSVLLHEDHYMLDILERSRGNDIAPKEQSQNDTGQDRHVDYDHDGCP